MDVVPGSDIQRAVESDCSQPNSRTNYLYQAEPINCVENHEVDMFEYSDQLNDSLLKTEGRGPTVSELLANSYCRNTGDLSFDYQVENTGREGALSFSEPTWLKEEESIALWVKWRGTWQVGIKCARADCPLSTLKAKPTHEQKRYFVIFFPLKKNYSWADMLFVRSIDEFPQPIAYKTHQEGLKMVKDLTVARRFIMQKLAVSILDTLDKLHSNALVGTACDVMVWKELAMEASRCNTYSDLGRMLLKLRNSIAPCHINANWVNSSSDSWAERCQNTNSAESVELLKEEWVDSILWNDVQNLRCVPVQPTLGSKWKTWKQDVMKWFSTSPSFSSSNVMQQQQQQQLQQMPDSAYRVSLQICRNRPKLQVRRAYTHTSLAGTKGSDHSITLETNPGFSKNQDTVSALAIVTSEQEFFREVPVETDLPSNLTDQCNEIVVEGIDSEILNSNGMESTPIAEMAGEKIMEPGTKYQQCIAYVEAKGRQCLRLAIDGNQYCGVHIRPGNKLKRKHEGNCTRSEGLICKAMVLVNGEYQQCIAYVEAKGRECVRLANDGNQYCGVHIRSLIRAIKAKKPVPIETSMCGGTTNAGTRCKHHSLPDFPFWKKRGPRAETRNKLKRKHEGNCTRSEGLICKDMVLVNDESPLQVVPVSASHGDCFLDKLLGNLALSDNDHNATEDAHPCLGCPPYDNEDPCFESVLWYSLYCEKHLPNWLRRSRTGKCRIISKEVFMEFLRDCSSWEQKVHLHKACTIFYILFKGILKNPELKDVQFQCAMTEAKKDPSVKELLRRLIFSEKDRIKLVLGLDNDTHIVLLMEGWFPPTAINDSFDNENGVNCKICNVEFADDRTLGNHWMENHEKEAKCLFRGFACAICLNSFTEKKLLENHVQGRHRMQFVEQYLLLQCIPCGSHFGNMEQLWLHLLSVHPVEFKLQLKVHEQEPLTVLPCEASPENLEQGNSASLDNDSQDPGTLMKFSCSLCELKFNLLPDLGRHHQAAHMGRNQISSKVAKRRALSSAHRLESGRLGRPKFKKGSSAVSRRTRSRANANLKSRIQETKSLRVKGTTVHLKSGSLQKGIVLCDDISFGKESIPVICVEDQETLNSQFQSPWESFTYVTKPRLDELLGLRYESLQRRCYCSFSTCRPETCDHVFLFNNEFDDAKDVFGKPMRGRFPYDENGCIILEEGYLVYECNNMCRCNKTCQNRILQNGIRVKLEVFKTEKKGWGVRAGEAILRGTFICELIGEVIDEREAYDRRKRFGKKHCSYFYDIDARFNDMSRMIEGQAKYVIDATRYGNVSRFINSSCSPNLVNYQVIVESMDDCKRSHIGLYASRDIALGEELTFDYHKVGPGKGTPCLCGSSNCRGRLY